MRDRLGDLERHLLDYIVARRAARWEDSYTAIHAAANIAPAQFSYAEATSAQQLHRTNAVIAALIRPEARATQPGGARMYWNLLTGAYHDAGEHNQELMTVRTARRAQPANAMLLTQELRALVALGRLDEIGARVDSLAMRPRDDWLTAGNAMTMVALELRAHGHEREARELFDRSIAWYGSRPAAERVLAAHRYFMGDALYQAGQFASADSIFRVLHREQPDETDYLGYLGVIALHRGNGDLARDIDSQLRKRERGIHGSYDIATVWRAAMAALQADSTTAMHLLTQAFGPNGTVELHTNSDFDRIRTYAPFRDFVRPKD
jgi:tetratricopeptide (TPR) repeat protein